MIQPGVALTVAGGVALLASAAGTLTAGGAAAAWLVGAAVLWGSGWAGGAVLGVFFVSSSLISHLVRADTAPAADPKGDCRDQWQVLANGGPALIGAMAGRGSPLALWVVTASLAAAAADTWATSTGSLSRRAPRHLLTGRLVPPGTSGGITWMGSLGAGAGALLVAATGAVAGADARLLGTAWAVGVAGMLLDSALGASVQGRFECPACGVSSEWPIHRCGIRTVRKGGWAWLTNDGVNALATGAAALAAWGLWSYWAASS